MRAWFWTILVIVVAVLLAILLQRYPGNVVLVAGEWRIQVSLAFGVLIAFAAFAVLYFTVRLINWFSVAPTRYRGWRHDRREKSEQNTLESGWIALMEGRYPQARKQLMHLADETRNKRRKILAFLSAARSAQAQGARDEADLLIEEAQQVAEHVKDKEDMRTAVAVAAADLWLQDGQGKRALEALDSVKLDTSKYPHMLRVLLRAYEEQGMYQEAIETVRLLQRRDAITPAKAAETIELCAAARLRQIEDQVQWNTFWKSLRSPERLYVDVALAGYAGFEFQEDNKNAERVLEQAIRESFDPRLLAAYGRATAEQVPARLQKAVSWLNQRPDDTDLLVTVGALCLTGQMWGQAQRYLERASRHRSDARLHALLGSLYEHMKQPNKAAKHWRLATASSAFLPVVAQDVYLPAADVTDDPKFHHVEGLHTDDEDDAHVRAARLATGDSIAHTEVLFSKSEPKAAKTSSGYEDYHEFFDSAPIPLDGVPVTSATPAPEPAEETTSPTAADATESAHDVGVEAGVAPKK